LDRWVGGVLREENAMEPLTSELAARLNPGVDDTGLRRKAEAIGYPLA
jgi:hypothetical protein